MSQWGRALSSLGFVLVIAGLSFGGGMTVIGFGGLLGAWFHSFLGAPLPLPVLHNSVERRLYLFVGLSGFAIWCSAFLYSLQIAP